MADRTEMSAVIAIQRASGVSFEVACNMRAVEIGLPPCRPSPWRPDEIAHLRAMRAEWEQGRWRRERHD